MRLFVPCRAGRGGWESPAFSNERGPVCRAARPGLSFKVQFRAAIRKPPLEPPLRPNHRIERRLGRAALAVGGLASAGLPGPVELGERLPRRACHAAPGQPLALSTMRWPDRPDRTARA
jgi:hypothetical protein